MPSYKVIKQGFFNGKLYSPGGKRPVLVAKKKFPMKGRRELTPSWLEPMIEETKEQIEERESVKDAEAKRVADSQKLIDEASFLGEGESTTVETL